MKTLFCIIGAVSLALLCGCSKPLDPKATNWEYKVVTVENFAHSMQDDGFSKLQTNSVDALREINDAKSAAGNFNLDGYTNNDYQADIGGLGAEGWELVSAIPQAETIWGAQDLSDSPLYANVRTGKIIMIFKRPLAEMVLPRPQ